MRAIWFITHPDVVIDPAKPVPRWSLSERGLARMRRFCHLPHAARISAVYSSDETKSAEAGSLLAESRGLESQQLEGLRENDRASTGYLPHSEFQRVADRFFAEPLISVEGWERATDAQSRIWQATRTVAVTDKTSGDIAIVSHGGVGALLICRLRGDAISRRHEQPGSGGGNFFLIALPEFQLLSGWMDIAETSGVPLPYKK